MTDVRGHGCPKGSPDVVDCEPGDQGYLYAGLGGGAVRKEGRDKRWNRKAYFDSVDGQEDCMF